MASSLERGDHDLDQRAAAEIGDADGGAGRQIVAEELGPGRVDLVETMRKALAEFDEQSAPD